jgi:UDP-N-acetylglucosamine diphosphorylase/glucosamine-1-phosphate N-acetyltransferase
MNIVLYDTTNNKTFWPLTTTKAIAALQLGILTIQDWWHQITKQDIYVKTIKYLQPLYKEPTTNELCYFINATVLPSQTIWQQIKSLEINEIIQDNLKNTIAFVGYYDDFDKLNAPQKIRLIDSLNIYRLTSIIDLLKFNQYSLQQQFALITATRKSKNISANNTLIHPENIFVEETADVQHCMINATSGFVYIGHNATIMEGTCIRGSFALGNNAVVKMGAKIYGTTTVGYHSTIGGELKNCIVAAHSNKAHDGYLGDSILGEWCNLGAGTSNSNVKNSAAEVKLYNYATLMAEDAGKKMGVVMGDYSRTAINSSINTGSSFGVCCNIFGVGLLPTIINNFSWGTQPPSLYHFNKAIRDINNWKQFKGTELTGIEIAILQHIFEETQNYNHA